METAEATVCIMDTDLYWYKGEERPTRPDDQGQPSTGTAAALERATESSAAAAASMDSVAQSMARFLQTQARETKIMQHELRAQTWLLSQIAGREGYVILH